MSEVWLYSLGSVAVISLVSLLGVFAFALKASLLNRILVYMISFSAGALLGDAFIHLLPELVEESGFGLEISLYILAGILLSFFVEKIIHWRHCHHPTTSSHPHPFAWMNLFGDAVHNFIDGLIIGAAYMVSLPVGIATTIAVVLHEIPQEIGDFGVLLHGGFSRGKALLLNFGISLLAMLGAAVAIIASGFVDNITVFLVPFAAGSFIYIAMADLIPEMHKEVGVLKSWIQITWFLFGIGLMVILV